MSIKFRKLGSLLLCIIMQPVSSGTMETTPSTSNNWQISADALYLQASYPAYAWSNERTVTDSSSNNTQSFGTSPGYDWGLFVEASYGYGNERDARLNVYYYDDATHSNDTLALGGSGWQTFFTTWSAANFELGKTFHFDESSDIRVHGGVQYSRIDAKVLYSQNINLVNSYTALNVSGLLTGTVQTVFNGFGPRVGADLGYQLSDVWSKAAGLHVYTNGAVGLLAGQNIYRANGSSTSGLLSGSASREVNLVVPEFDIKLGLDYLHHLNQGDLTLDAGWLWTDYVSSVNWSRFAANGDVAFQGLYFGLKWKGCVA